MKIRSYDDEWELEGLQASMLAAREHCVKSGCETHVLGNDGGFVCGFRIVRLSGSLPRDAVVEQFFDCSVGPFAVGTCISSNQYDLVFSSAEACANAARREAGKGN